MDNSKPMEQLQTDLNYQFLKHLADLDFVENIYLFGSRARGDNDPKSDIDLAVNCPTATDNDWQRVLDIIENADTLLQTYEEATAMEIYQHIKMYYPAMRTLFETIKNVKS